MGEVILMRCKADACEQGRIECPCPQACVREEGEPGDGINWIAAAWSDFVDAFGWLIVGLAAVALVMLGVHAILRGWL